MITNRCWTAVIFLLFLGFALSDKAIATLKSVENKETQLLNLPVRILGQATEFLDGPDLKNLSRVSKQGLLIAERSGFQPTVPLLSELRDTAFFPSAVALRNRFPNSQDDFAQFQTAAFELNEGMQVLQALLKQPTTVGLKRVHLKTIQARLQLVRRALANRVFEYHQSRYLEHSEFDLPLRLALSLGLPASQLAEAELEGEYPSMDSMAHLVVIAASRGDKVLMSQLLTKVRELDRDNYAELARSVYLILAEGAPQELKLDEFLHIAKDPLKDPIEKNVEDMAVLNLRVGYQRVAQKADVDKLLKQIEARPEVFSDTGPLAGVATLFAQDAKSIDRFIQSLEVVVKDEKIQENSYSKIVNYTRAATALRQMVEQVTDPAHLEGDLLDFAGKVVATSLDDLSRRDYYARDYYANEAIERGRLVGALIQKLPKNEKAWALLEILPLYEQFVAVSALIRVQAGLSGPDSRLMSHFRSLAGDISLASGFFSNRTFRESANEMTIIESIANDPELSLKYREENFNSSLSNLLASALIPYSSKDSKIRDFILEKLRFIDNLTGRCLIRALGRTEELDPALRERLYSLVAQSSREMPKLPILILLDSLSPAPAPVKKVPGLVSKVSGSVATFFRKWCH